MSKPLECGDDRGISIGLIDTLITVARVVRARLDFDEMICGERGDRHQPVREALKDLSGCREMRELLDLHDDEAIKIIHAAAERLEKGGACSVCKKRRAVKAAALRRYRAKLKGKP